MKAMTLTAEELLSYGEKMAQRKGFRRDTIEDAAQEFAVGAWLAQQQLDASKAGEGEGMGFLTRGGLNQMKAFVRQSVKAERIGRKSVNTDLDGAALAESDARIISGDYNGEDGEGGAMSFWETLADPKAKAPSAALESEDLTAKAEQALAALDPREQAVLLARGEGQTLAEIGAALNLTRERVRQIEAEARAKALRHF